MLLTGLEGTGNLGPITSSDGAFSVKVPTGWIGTGGQVAGAHTVLAMARLKKAGGAETHVVVGSFVGASMPLDNLQAGWEELQASGKFGMSLEFGSFRQMTLDGQPAVAVDVQTAKTVGQIIFVDYRGNLYLVEMQSDPGEYDQVQSGDFATILSSWRWK